MMRLLLIHERYRQRGGEDAVFEDEAALLAASGCRVERLEVDNHDIDPRAGGLALAARAIWSRRGRTLVDDAISEFRPDIVHVHNWFPLLSPAIHSAIHRRGVPLVQTLHNFRLACLNGLMFRDGAPCQDCLTRALKWPGVARRCYRNDIKASAAVALLLAVHRGLGTWTRRVDRFLAYSDFARQRFIAAGLPAGRIERADNCAPDPGAAAAGWDHPRAGALFVGRLSDEKGIATLLQAWRGLDHRLTIVGDGPLAEPLRRTAAGIGGDRIAFLGACPPETVSRLLTGTRLVCVPSSCYEQQPRIIAEAGAHGVPVLAAGHGGVGAAIVDGVTGRHAPPGDVAAWADAAARLLADPGHLAALGAAARTHYLARHAPPVVAAARINLYCQLTRPQS